MQKLRMKSWKIKIQHKPCIELFLYKIPLCTNTVGLFRNHAHFKIQTRLQYFRHQKLNLCRIVYGL
jgi:hypothetical protein